MLNVVMLSVVMLKADSPRAKMSFFCETHLSTCAIKAFVTAFWTAETYFTALHTKGRLLALLTKY
jgi:hypothetical protein